MREFEESLPMTLLIAREAVMSKFMPFLRENNLSPQQWRVLRVLMENNDIDAKELAERCYLKKSSLSRIIQNLENRKLIVRYVDANDQRRAIISISRRGKDLFLSLVPRSEERYAFIENTIGPEKLEELYTLLHDVIIKLQEK